MLLQTVTGMETFASASAKVYAFVMPSRQHPGAGKELPLATVAKAGLGISCVGPKNDFPCAPNFRPELGRWVRAVYDMPEGTLIKIFTNRNSSSFGAMRVMANLILKMREGAALQRVGVILTGAPNATISRANFEGRFDILTAPQALALGANIPLSMMGFFEDTMTRRAFEIAELERAISSPAVVEVASVQNSEGQRVDVAVTRRHRILGV